MQCQSETNGKKVLDIFYAMPEKKLNPNAFTYNTVIHIIVNQGYWEKALVTLRDMQNKGFQPHSMIYNNIIMVMEKELNIYRQVQNEKKKDDISPYITFSVSVKKGKLEEASKIFQYLEGSQLNLSTVNILIDKMVQEAKWEKALLIFQQMKEKGLQPNDFTYKVLAKAAKREKYLGFRPDPYTYKKLITTFGEKGRWEETLDVFIEMQKEGIVPDNDIYIILIRTMINGGQWQKALRIFEQIPEPNISVYNELIDGLGREKQWEKTLEIYRKFLEKGLQPNEKIYHSLIDSMGNGGQVKKALDIFRKMQEDGLQPDYITYQKLVNAIKKGNHWEEAFEILRNMQKKGFSTGILITKQT